MATTFMFRTVLEIAMVIFLVWGFANENKFIEFEDKCIWLISAYIRKIKRKRAIKKDLHTNYNLKFNKTSQKNEQNKVHDIKNRVA